MPQTSVNWDTCLDHAAATDIGLRRTGNQDSYGVLLASTPEAWQRRGHLFIVADGMGGHAAGEYASKLAVEHVEHNYHKLPDESAPQALRKAIEEANHTIHVRGQANLDFHGMGTTSSVLLLLPQGAVVAHVGDSRVYRQRGNRLEQLSFDHSLVWELMASGQLSRNDLPTDIRKNIILRSLGPNAEVKVDLEGPFPLAVGDTFLICSDGLSGQVTNEEMSVILQSLTPQEAVKTFIDLANLRGGPDNITVIVVRVTGQLAEAAASGGFQMPPVWVWIGPVAMALLAAGAFVVQQPAVAAGLIGLAALYGVVASVVQMRRGGSGVDRRGQLGKGPYDNAIVSPNQGFVDELKRLLQQLREAAATEDWVVDWTRFDASTKRADEAVARREFAVAVRENCLALSMLMGELRNQREGGSKVKG